MKILRTLIILALVPLFQLSSGCSTAKYQPVTGQIVFADGTPVQGLEGGRLNALPAAGGPDAKTPSGPIDGAGKFTLGTDGLADGAPEGEYQLSITVLESTGDEMLPEVIHPKYKQPGGFPKTFTVQKGSNHWKVEVERAPMP